MTSLALWTWISVVVLVLVPPVVFVLFLRDARRMFEDLKVEQEEGAPPPPPSPSSRGSGAALP